MLSFTGGVNVFLALESVDLRQGFEGLTAMVTQRLGEDLRQGALFVASNRRHNRLKILYWDRTGLWLLMNRLEKGTFSWPQEMAASRWSYGWSRRPWRCSLMGSIFGVEVCDRG